MPSIFTKIIAGEIPGHFVWKDDKCVAIMTIRPLAEGHVLVIPREEVDHWIDCDAGLLAHVMSVSQTIAGAIQANGVLFKGDDGKVYMRLNWDKRWITLAAISTVLGLAFKLSDLALYASGNHNYVTPVLDVGWSTRPEFARKYLSTSISYTNRSDLRDFSRHWRWGGVVNFCDEFSMSFSLNTGEYAIGISGHIDSLVLGLGYKVEDLSTTNWMDKQASSLLAELGLLF